MVEGACAGGWRGTCSWHRFAACLGKALPLQACRHAEGGRQGSAPPDLTQAAGTPRQWRWLLPSSAPRHTAALHTIRSRPWLLPPTAPHPCYCADSAPADSRKDLPMVCHIVGCGDDLSTHVRAPGCCCCCCCPLLLHATHARPLAGSAPESTRGGGSPAGTAAMPARWAVACSLPAVFASAMPCLPAAQGCFGTLPVH